MRPPKAINSSISEPQPLISLITDFGIVDEYVGVLKGVILNHCALIQIVDISHQIPPQNIKAASHLLGRSYTYFPPNSVHLVVVDPGVGTDRALLVIQHNNQVFVGPDNGVFSPILQLDEIEVRKITNSELFLKNVSSTFHGRDIMAPVAAKLACGLSFEEVGPRIDPNGCFINANSVAKTLDNSIKGEVVYIDRFGNLCTNITKNAIEELTSRDVFIEEFSISIGDTTINTFSRSYNAPSTRPLIALFDSQDFLEIAKASGSAAEDLGLQGGAEILVEIQRKV